LLLGVGLLLLASCQSTPSDCPSGSSADLPSGVCQGTQSCTYSSNACSAEVCTCEEGVWTCAEALHLDAGGCGEPEDGG
jgi:hypothetical protein